MRFMVLFAFTICGIAIACSDGEATDPNGPPVPEAGTDATLDSPDTSTTPPRDAGVDPDARGEFNPVDVPVGCDASPCATQIVAGSTHFCARMNDGTVRCWGHNAFEGERDAGGVRTIDLASVSELGAGGGTTCARLSDGTVKCWGDNRRAQLGGATPDEDPHPTPSVVTLESPATRVDVGQGVACAHLASGKLWCWGRDDQSQLVRTSEDGGLDPANPVRGPGHAAIEPVSLVGVAASDHTMLGLDSKGDVWTWGALAGDLGTVSGRIGSIAKNIVPKRIESLGKVTKLVASVWIDPPFNPPPGPTPPKPPARAHACALASGEVYCWGKSYTGALCTAVPDKEQEPAHAPLPDTVKTWPQQLAVGDEITCARMTDGSIHCCGSDTRGRLGTGSLVVLSSSFTKAQAFTGYAVQVATSDDAVCALVRDGTVECWGSNVNGELGRTPDEDDHPSPVKVVLQ